MDSSSATTVPGAPHVAVPTLGRLVIYRSKLGDGIESPAIVTVTRDTWRPQVRAAAHDAPIEELTSETEMRPTQIPQPTSPHRVSLAIFGASSVYHEHDVPWSDDPNRPFSWHWPVMVDDYGVAFAVSEAEAETDLS